MGMWRHNAAVIAVANPRQGVGKSVVALNLAASLALTEKRVLLVVADPRHTVATQNTGRVTIYEVLREDVPLAKAVLPSPLQHLEIVPAAPALWRLDIELLRVKGRELLLSRALALVGDFYDFILIDCPSSSGLLTLSALAAAHTVIVPVAAAAPLCVEAEQLLQVITAVRRNLNTMLGGVHLLLNKSVPAAFARDDATTRQLLPTSIPDSVDIAAAAALGLPAVLHVADGRGAVAFRQLTTTLLPVLSRTTHAPREQSL